jgi:hypothetical protein
LFGLYSGRQKAEAMEPPQAKNAARAAQLDELAAPLLGFLQQAGLQRESLALNAGLAVAKQLGPFSLVALALIAGFIMTNILAGKRETRPTL